MEKAKKSPRLHKCSTPVQDPLHPPPSNRRSFPMLNNPWIQKPLSAYQISNTLTETHKDHHGLPSSILQYGTHPHSHSSDPTTSISPSKHTPPHTDHASPPPPTSSSSSFERHMSLFDLTSLGIGGTIGSGIFVLCGVIAHSYAGPATFLSWTIAGIAAVMSGCCYAELAAQLPSAGSAYVYVYASMGELPAVLVAGCLTLEYVASASAVARSWGEKVDEWGWHTEMMSSGWFTPESLFNPMACLISTGSVLLLLLGVKESKVVMNVFTMTKVGVVLFMTVGGLLLLEPSNLTPMIPPQFGWSGVFRGATSSFFGYLGFDEICCVAGEAQNPKRNIPYSILLTLGMSTTIYILASFALTGMQPYQVMDGIEGFPGAFTYNGYPWAAQLTAAGEILTLPIVVLITIMAQPRLQYALAQDGLFPSWFAQFDSKGNLWNGTVSSGIIMITIASFVPFTHLNDMISAGVLVSFCMTSSALLLLRHDSPGKMIRPTTSQLSKSTSHSSLSSYPNHHPSIFVDSNMMETLVAMLNIFSFVASILITHYYTHSIAKGLAFLCLSGSVLCCAAMYLYCPPSKKFGGEKRHSHSRYYYPSEYDVKQDDHEDADEDGYFKTPFVPFLPCLAIFINWYLISQLELFGIFLLLFFLGTCAMFYFFYSAKHSLLRKGLYAMEDDSLTEGYHNDGYYEEDGSFGGSTERSDLLMLRSISLPRRG